MRSRDGLTDRLFAPGRNCWTTDHADRFSVIQDGEIYFRLVRDAILRAERSVFALSWDINAGTDLTPGEPPGPVPSRLGRFLSYAARRKPKLQIYILTWDYGLPFVLERDPFTRWRLGWSMPRNVRLAFDDHHPVGACHHQKVIVVDDVLAFSGSLDLTGHRWDTTRHQVGDPLRVDPMGRPYDPYHEVQAMMDGPAAAKLGSLARDRWRAVGVTTLPAVAPAGHLWPDDVPADFTDVDVAIARTIPGSAGQPAVRECEGLYFDAIAQARRTIYIENQYFTHPRVADALAARLREPDGPEIVAIVPRGGEGWLDRNSIQIMRNELFQQLTAVDVHGRLRLVHPLASRQPDVSTFIHSKVLVVDDALLLVGSANTNRRSMGMDTECDVAVAPDTATGRAAVTSVRDRLMGEHLGLEGAAVSDALRDAGSLCALIDARQANDRTLLLFDQSEIVPAPLDDALRYAVDPDGPLDLGAEIDSMMPAAEGPTARVPLRIWIFPVVALVAAVAAAWGPVPVEPAPVAIDDSSGHIVTLLVAAGLTFVPFEPLLVATGLIFGLWPGAIIAASATIVSAVAGYAAGRWLGAPTIARRIPTGTWRSIRHLGRNGWTGMAMLRLTGVSSVGTVHLASGANRIPFAAYMIGTVIGLIPAAVALTWLGALLKRTIAHPSVDNALVTALGSFALLACALALRAFLLIRQFSPSSAPQRARVGLG